MQRIRQVVLGLILLTIIIVLTIFIVSRVRAANRYGEAFSACPGPDLFGYRCERDSDVEYIDATNDTMLYADDSTVLLEIPFPFDFYGSTYTEVNASSNGLLYFGEGTRDFRNECPIHDGYLEGFGEIIAPYWDDLNLAQEGLLQTEVVGAAPERIFVIEWDTVPRFGAATEYVTFEVQLFETTNDIVFLYDTVSVPSASNGRSSTIAIQSELHEVSLTAGCDQPSVSNDSNIKLIYPPIPNPDLAVSPSSQITSDSAPAPIQEAKGEAKYLIDQLNLHGGGVMPNLDNHWLQQIDPRVTEWAWADVTGNGRDELVLIWRQPQQHNHLLIVGTSDNGEYHQIWRTTLSKRPESPIHWSLLNLQDRTANGRADIILTTTDHKRRMLSWSGQQLIDSR